MERERMSRRVRARRLRSAVGWTVLGAVTIALIGPARVSAADTGPSAQRRKTDAPFAGGASFFAADRDAGQLIALDSELFEVGRQAAPFVLELEARTDGKLWVASASALGPLGPHWLRKLDALGAVEVDLAIGPLLDLAALDGDAALLVTLRPDGLRDAAIVSGDGTSRVLSTGPMLAAVAGQSGRVVLGAADGGLKSMTAWPSPQLTAERVVGGVIADIAPGPTRTSFYVLDVAGAATAHRLLLVDADLNTVWERPVGMGGLHLAVTPDRQRVWLADGAGRFARRFGATGALEVSFAPLPAAGCDFGAAERSGGVVFAAPGVLVRLDATGAAVPGQGGFDFLVDVEARAQP